MTREKAMSFVDQSIASGIVVSDELADLYKNGQLSEADWLSYMRSELKMEYIRQGVLAAGGRGQMKPADWGSIGGALAEQYKWLKGFAAVIGTLSVLQIKARAAMYFNSAREVFFRVGAKAQGIDYGRLPAYPGDGSSECLTNCRCEWIIVTIRDEAGKIVRWECTWKFGETEDHCATCEDRASKWKPFILYPK